MRWRSTVLFLLVGTIWGSEWMATRELDSQPLAALALRYGIASCLLGVAVFVRQVRLPGPRVVAISAISGISFAAVPAMLITWAGGRVSPGLLVVILAMTPLLAALMEGRASGATLMALVGGVAGTSLLASQGLSFAWTQWAGAAALLAAAAMIAASVVTVKREIAEVPVVLLGAIQLASAAVCVALWSIVAEGRSGFDWDRKLIAAEAVLALMGGALALPLYYWLLRERESFQLTASQWLATVVGVGEGLLLLREAPGWRLIAGAAILLLSLGTLMQQGRDEPVTIALTGTSPR